MKFRKGQKCPRCQGKLEESKPDSKNKKINNYLFAKNVDGLIFNTDFK